MFTLLVSTAVIVLTSRYSHICDVISTINLFCNYLLMLTVTHGQRGNFAISLPVSGLPFPLLALRLSPRSFCRKLYKGDSGEKVLFTSYLASVAAAIVADLAPF
jgi:hypothetical protein